MDSLLSIVQMPRGIPVGTLAIGEAGAVNAALLAASIVALGDAAVRAPARRPSARPRPQRVLRRTSCDRAGHGRSCPARRSASSAAASSAA